MIRLILQLQLRRESLSSIHSHDMLRQHRLAKLQNGHNSSDAQLRLITAPAPAPREACTRVLAELLRTDVLRILRRYEAYWLYHLRQVNPRLGTPQALRPNPS